MGTPKRKTSKMRLRTRKGANRYRGIKTVPCKSCGSKKLAHRACPTCGDYNDRRVLTVEAK
ncbi:MAG: 50S ribosomal protein L32 [Verrucomicrobiae bacterium]|nr:50S ribosomal protein L32 [Verrucomicrobiae bacterium]